APAPDSPRERPAGVAVRDPRLVRRCRRPLRGETGPHRRLRGADGSLRDRRPDGRCPIPAWWAAAHGDAARRQPVRHGVPRSPVAHQGNHAAAGDRGIRPVSFELLTRLIRGRAARESEASMKSSRRLCRAAGVLIAAVALAACDDAMGPGLEVDIEQVVLRVGTESTTLRATQKGTLTIDEGTHDVTISVRDSNDRMVSLGIDYELQITSSNQGVARYSPLSNLEGTLVTAPGTASLQLRIIHNSHMHFSVPVTVTVN